MKSEMAIGNRSKREIKMIELKNDSLEFSFPKVHKDAKLTIDFQRTLRIPDDDNDYPLPPGLGSFPLRHVDDFAAGVPESWIAHGGVMLPMYQSEALWLNFPSGSLMRYGEAYPFAVKIATGKIDAVTGHEWSTGLHRDPQDYVVTPEQPWLDGYCVEKGIIRQFVAMPLGSGYSVEEQLTGAGEYGGIQIIAYPLKREVYENYLKEHKGAAELMIATDTGVYACKPDMGLAPGGRMRQEIFDDPFDLEDWDTEHSSRCFMHIANSLVWRAITGDVPPTPPPTANEYESAGLPWFDYYNETATAVDGSKILSKVKSVVNMGKQKGDNPLPENESVTPETIVQLRSHLTEDQVREGEWGQ